MAAMDQAPVVFDGALLGRQPEIPSEFVWPEEERPVLESGEELCLPIIDLKAFLSGDPSMELEIPKMVRDACERHGFFLVTNHGVKQGLLSDVHHEVESFFSLPLSEKKRAQRKTGESNGYASSLTGRFFSNLPWKETMSFRHSTDSTTLIPDYFTEKMGKNSALSECRMVFEQYCKEMTRVSLEIMELLGMSLGVGRSYFRDFYESHDSIMRLNYYPLCQKPGLTLGTGPHTDPTSLTILHQDAVDGLQVLMEGRWHTIRPSPDTFVVNIGDTFKAMTNGRYQSCLHRAVVNNEVSRKSMAFFLCPMMDKIVRAPEELVDSDHPRAYPDFTWAELLEFTQKHYRVDVMTLEAFSRWIANKCDN